MYGIKFPVILCISCDARIKMAVVKTMLSARLFGIKTNISEKNYRLFNLQYYTGVSIL